MTAVAKDYGKSRLFQILEMFRLAIGDGHLKPKEYFEFCLFDDTKFSFSDKKKFVGTTSQEQIKKIIIDDTWKILSVDKFHFATFFGSQEFPLARILATYNYRPNKRGCSVPSLNTKDDLKSFLMSGAEFPIFAKPICGSHGSGAIRIDALDRTRKQMTLALEGIVSVDQFIERLGRIPDGYMFQDVLKPHPAIRDVCGDQIATVRVVVLVTPQDARLFRASWKIPAGETVVDNFLHGRVGNLLAAVDIDDGRVKRVVRGVGVDQQELEVHPNTGKKLLDFRLPCWSELKLLCLEAATVLPGFRMQSWDIAICDEGPILQEVQAGDFDILQIASQEGMLDNDFRRWLGSINKRWRLEVTLSALDQIPREIYRRRYAKQSY